MIAAIYHCSIKIISRGKGRSAVAAAAYRSGEKLVNDYDGVVHDFSKKGGVIYSEILLPDNAPREFIDRSVLWNAVEAAEKSKNAQLSLEAEILFRTVDLLKEHKHCNDRYCVCENMRKCADNAVARFIIDHRE